MLNPTLSLIHSWSSLLAKDYLEAYGPGARKNAELLEKSARRILVKISTSNAPYHNTEHTFLVAWVGQAILQGKLQVEGNVAAIDWLHFMLSLLCHDIGYVRGVCRQDQVSQGIYTAGVDESNLSLAAGATDASLAPYHVDRSKCFAEENFKYFSVVDVERLKQNIEATRFPPAQQEDFRSTPGYPQLARAADLIGQLSDPKYLQKIPALFYELEEIDAHQKLGYSCPDAMRRGYPAFYRGVVYPHIRQALPYLMATLAGRKIVAQLSHNVACVEHELNNLAA